MEHHGYIEPMHKGNRAKAERVQLIIRALSDRFTGEPFPAMSDHFQDEVSNSPINQSAVDIP